MFLQTRLHVSAVLLFRFARNFFSRVLNLMVYYNLTYASTLLGGNPYLCFILVAITEYPIWIVAVLLIKYIKRRPSYLIVLSISAICSAASMFLPKRKSMK